MRFSLRIASLVCFLKGVSGQSIEVNRDCYRPTDDLVITFVNDQDSRPDDWVGILESHVDIDDVTEYMDWRWTCGDKDCDEPESSGTMVWSPHELTPGESFKVALLRDIGPPYQAYAVSDVFTIVGSSQSCNDDSELSFEAVDQGQQGRDTLPDAAIAVDVDGDILPGETFQVSFENDGPLPDDFIAIYPASMAVGSTGSRIDDGLLWLWTCDRQGSNDCSSATGDGTVQFRPGTDWETGAWPLRDGDYVALLLRDGAAPFRVLAESDVFSVSVNHQVDMDVLRQARRAIRILVDSDRALAPKFLRLIFHDCIGGCDGCVDLQNEKNFGLRRPIEALEGIVDTFGSPEGLSRADIWALAAITAAQRAQGSDRVRFSFEWFGRIDCENANEVCRNDSQEIVPCSATRGPHREIPGNHMHTRDLYNFFRDEFGFTQRDTVAIMGVHTIGVLASENSGIDGRDGWVPGKDILNNEYFEHLIGGDSANDPVQVLVNSAPRWRRSFDRNNDNQFGVQRFWDGFPEPDQRIIMLNTDIALIRDLDEDNLDSETGRCSCAFEDDTAEAEGDPVCPHVAGAIQIAAEFAHDNRGWLNAFEDVLGRMVNNGYDLNECSESVCRLTPKSGFAQLEED